MFAALRPSFSLRGLDVLDDYEASEAAISSYGEVTERRPIARPARCHLEYWLMCRGLESKYEALRSLGAKKVSDLAHLTKDDHKLLGLDEAQAKLLTIHVVG